MVKQKMEMKWKWKQKLTSHSCSVFFIDSQVMYFVITLVSPYQWLYGWVYEPGALPVVCFVFTYSV